MDAGDATERVGDGRDGVLNRQNRPSWLRRNRWTIVAAWTSLLVLVIGGGLVILDAYWPYLPHGAKLAVAAAIVATMAIAFAGGLYEVALRVSRYRRGWQIVGCLGLVLPVLYVLSEAPALRFTGEKCPACHGWRVYGPLDTLYLHDEWGRPLRAWARWWGVEDAAIRGAIVRGLAHGTGTSAEFFEDIWRYQHESAE